MAVLNKLDGYGTTDSAPFQFVVDGTSSKKCFTYITHKKLELQYNLNKIDIT
jgi:hypothetical protein